MDTNTITSQFKKINRKKFQKIIWDFYKKNKRILPWRNISNPYFILVSEIMLQQTQVSRVVPKYNSFIQQFPTIESLAQSDFKSVLNIWSGLGYNRRAQYLHNAAQKIVQEKLDIAHLTPTLLATLPGIGKNTAASIYTFSYNKPALFIETNIRRVIIHFFFNDAEKIHDNELLPLIEKTLDYTHPREWYYALMDYGNYLSKIVVNPNRKSMHYTKQSPLKGSVREARGRILKVLIKTHQLSLQELISKVQVEEIRFHNALFQLQKENFIEIKDNAVFIKQ